jgi:flagellin-like protein
MALHRRWRLARRRGISEVIGAILLIALTVVAGVILWTFQIYNPPAPPTVSFVIRAGGSNPVWGDPTDCQPWGGPWTYPATGAELTKWLGHHDDPSTTNSWWGQCGDGDGPNSGVNGNYAELNTSEFIISGHTPSDIPLTEIEFTFVCNNASNNGGTTILVNGSLASMTWFPGVSKSPAADAPYLGYCGNFEAGNSSASNGIYYNRLGLFVPLQNITNLENGDTFILYIHNGGYPLDYECVANAAGVNFADETNSNGCRECTSGTGYPTHTPCNAIAIPQLDYDDYHGAPPWCFLTVNACTIYLTYTGTPSTVLAEIPVYDLAPAQS